MKVYVVSRNTRFASESAVLLKNTLMCRVPASMGRGNGWLERKSASMKLAFVGMSTTRTSSCPVSGTALSQMMCAYAARGSVKVASFLQPSATATTPQTHNRNRVIATLARER